MTFAADERRRQLRRRCGRPPAPCSPAICACSGDVAATPCSRPCSHCIVVVLFALALGNDPALQALSRVAAGGAVGRGAAGRAAGAGHAVPRRRRGRLAGAMDAGAGAAGLAGRGAHLHALGDHRAGRYCWPRLFWPQLHASAAKRSLPVLMAVAGAGHAAAEPDRRGGRGIDRGHAPLRYPCRAARAAAVRAGAGLRRRQRRRAAAQGLDPVGAHCCCWPPA